MHIGYATAFGSGDDGRRDAAVFHQELGFALQAEMWGFDSIWVSEGGASAAGRVPDAPQLLSFLAGQTRQLGLAAVVDAAGRDPEQLARQVALSDQLSAGRVILGIGSPADLPELLGALTVAPDAAGASRPRPLRTFAGRTFARAASPAEGGELAAAGVGLLVDGPGEALVAYREAWAAVHRSAVPGPVCFGDVWVDVPPDPEGDGGGGDDVGIDADDGPPRPDLGPDVLAGTPAAVVTQLAALRDGVGMAAFVARLSLPGMSHEAIERNVAGFVDLVMPAVHDWATPALLRELS